MTTKLPPPAAPPIIANGSLPPSYCKEIIETALMQ